MGLTASLLVIVVILVISTSIGGLFQRCPMVLHIYRVATNLLTASLYIIDEINSLLQTVSRFFSEIKHIITFSKYTLNILKEKKENLENKVDICPQPPLPAATALHKERLAGLCLVLVANSFFFKTTVVSEILVPLQTKTFSDEQQHI